MASIAKLVKALHSEIRFLLFMGHCIWQGLLAL